MIEIVGVSLKKGGKIYYFSPNGLKLKKGDNVTQGQLVAYVGPKYLKNGKLNGMTTGPHLHFTLYKKRA